MHLLEKKMVGTMKSIVGNSGHLRAVTDALSVHTGASGEEGPSPSMNRGNEVTATWSHEHLFPSWDKSASSGIWAKLWFR